jgi:hypothetical protein
MMNIDAFLKNPKWSLPFDTKSVSIVTPEPVVPESNLLLGGMLARDSKSYENLTLSLQVLGIHSLPDQWKAKIVNYNFVTDWRNRMIHRSSCISME